MHSTAQRALFTYKQYKNSQELGEALVYLGHLDYLYTSILSKEAFLRPVVVKPRELMATD